MSPRFSLVVPCYNVAAYLPEFLASITDQSEPLTDCEFVFVDDGSPDDSARMIADWIDDAPVEARLIRQDNGGLSAARNTGLRNVEGEWVSFPDPDDVLDPDYVAAVRRFLADLEDRAETAEVPRLLCTHAYVLDETTGRLSDSHPLRRRFRKGNRLVNLARSPEFIHLQAASAFYRLTEIRRLELLFDGRIRPNFEDAFFTALYLSAEAEPTLGLIADAAYRYRRRQDRSSLVQQSWHMEEKYSTVLEYGYLALLETLHRRLGTVPRWAQNLVLYDLLFYFRHEQRADGKTRAADPAWYPRFHQLVARIMAFIAAETIDGFDLVPTDPALKHALITGYRRERLRPEIVSVRLDTSRRLQQLRYFFDGELPQEAFEVDGQVVRPVYGKIRDLRFFGRLLVQERIVWLPAGTELRVRVDARVVHQSPKHEPSPVVAGPVDTIKQRLRRRARWLLNSLRKIRRRPDPGPDPYARAWTFIDSDSRAGDNAEHLYRWVQQHRPEVNAYFVLSPSAPDWPRLEAEDFRLIAFGSAEHTSLLRSTEHLISSRADRRTLRPLPRRYGDPTWHFTFLQHERTTEADLRRLDDTVIDRLATASRTQHHGIVDDHTPYAFTDKEVALTGFPRHDQLLRRAEQVDQPRLLLFRPTEPETVAAWREVAFSDQLRRLAQEAGVEIALVSHDEPDSQALLAEAMVLVTDHVGLAAEAAFLQRPAVMFRPDRTVGQDRSLLEEFGPVVVDPHEAVSTIIELIATRSSAEPYRARAKSAFPHRDGRCCERTYASIVALTAPTQRSGPGPG